MSSTIKLKRTDVPGRVPVFGSQLVEGELAINLADKKLFTANSTAVFSVSGDLYEVDTSVPGSGNGTGANINLTCDNASIATDTIAFTAGQNMTITRDAGTGSIEIAHTGASALTAGQVQTTNLQNGAVTGQKIAADAVALGNHTTGSYIENLVQGNGIALLNNSGESAQPTVSLAPTITGLTSVSSTAFVGALTGDVTGDVTGDLTGDVTGDVTGDLTGNSAGTHTGPVTGALTGNSAGTHTGPVTGALTGNVSGNVNGDVTGALFGNAATATKIITPVTIAIAGDQAGTVQFDGSQAVTITTQTQNDSVDLGTHTTGMYVANASGTANEITVTGGGSETATLSIGLPSDVTIANDLTVSNDATVAGDLTVTGGLDVNGTLTYIDSTTVAIGDGMIELSKDNTADSIDIGFYGMYVAGGVNKYSGISRDSASGAFQVWADTASNAQPGQTVNYAGATLGQLNAVIDGGSF